MEGAVLSLRAGYLGLGSNVGDRCAHLRGARDALSTEVVVVAASSIYETEPQGLVVDQPDFLNACLAIETDREPEQLLDTCKRIERELGRERGGVRHGPRAIDIDLLLLGDLELRSDRLVLPHRDLLSRRFVVAPLLELDPALKLPDGTPLAHALERLDGQRVTRLGPL